MSTTHDIPPRAATSGSDLRAGMASAAPVVFGYLPIGLAYGVLGTAAGVPAWAVIAMSVLVYAGSSQFMAVSLLSQGASTATIVLTTLLVNLRHALYSSALSPRVERMSRGRLAWVAAEITDETFVVAARASAERDGRLSFAYLAGLNGVAQAAWVTGSAIGALAGALVGDPARVGLDYALVAMFIGLLALQVRRRSEVGVAAVAAGLSLALHLLGLGMSGVIVATVLAAGLGSVWVGRA